MIRLFILFALLISFLQQGSHPAVLKKITFSETPEKLRVVLATDVPVRYKANRSNSYITISLPNTKMQPGISPSISSRIIENLSVYAKDSGCEVRVNFKYLTSSSIFALSDPNRIVADFKQISKMTIPKMTVPEIESITTKSEPDKFRIVVRLTSFVPYKISTSEGGLIIELPDTNSVIKSRKIVTNDRLIPKVAIDQVGKSVFLSIAQIYPSFCQIYKKENPSSLVIEFDKTSKYTIATNQIVPGLRYIKFIKGTTEGPSTVYALIVDQTSHEVFPYFSKRAGDPSNLIGTIGSIFTFWMPKEEEEKQKKDRISNMVKDAGAVAGINGSFFGDKGEPLGVLMINGELVSYSIYDRTALIIDKSNNCYIDNVSLAGEASIEGSLVQIAGINQKRQQGEAIVYTSRYGDVTDEDSPGIVLSVVGNEIKNISRARAWIPKDGYALSLDSSYFESIGDKAKIGSKIGLVLKLIPLSAIPNLDIKHVIGGGPRLLKSGQIYISRNIERFKNDVAKSRAARSAVGIMRDGSLAFVTVDKCKQAQNTAKSMGVTLEELAQIMKEIGCADAMNLDGGSSSTMVLSAEVINNPSSGSERPVSNGILIR